MKVFVIEFLVFIGLCGCVNQPHKPYLEGAWKVDSTYSFYNGFDFTEKKSGQDWATYVFEKDGLMKEVKFESFRSYQYEWLGVDTLVMISNRGGDRNYYQLLALAEDQLILKKTKQGVFDEENANRYEIRYLSRTVVPSGNLIPFKDPRKN